MENHGWVKPRADGMRARCGGPGICQQCSKERVQAMADTVKEQSALKSITDWNQVCPAEHLNLQLLWYLYRKIAGLNTGVRTVTIEDARAAFMAGFTECFKLVTDYCANLEEDDAMKFMDRLMNECTAEIAVLKQRKV